MNFQELKNSFTAKLKELGLQQKDFGTEVLGGFVGVRPKGYIPTSAWSALHTYVLEELGGEYIQEKRGWKIPFEPE